MELDDVIDELTNRLGHYPPARYPVQHATTQFHLGQALLQAGRTQDATAALRVSIQQFPPAMVIERAKVLNLLGAALRAGGHLEMAAAAFTNAAEVFAQQELWSEQGAALFNLGLVQRDSGDPQAAAGSFAKAQARFTPGPPGPQAAAAVHLGKALLEVGEIEAATASLERAVELGDRTGDLETIGVASNALGLAHHAAGRTDAAVAALRAAVAAHPRSIRPAEFAMAKANLALAYDAVGAPAEARLAARQALAADPPAPVRDQARAVLDRAGCPAGSDLLDVLDRAPDDEWNTTVRDELVRWTAARPDERAGEVRAWIGGLARRADSRDALIHVWLSALIELPPADLERLAAAVVHAGADVDAETFTSFRSALDRQVAWFPVPQMLRLRNLFEPCDQPDQEGAWSPPRI